MSRLPSSSFPSRIRRAHGVHFYIRDSARPDIGSLLRGSVDFELATEVVAVNTRDQREHVLCESELQALSRIESGRWTDVDDATKADCPDRKAIASLLDRGLLIADSGIPASQSIDLQGPRLETMGWYRHAASYQGMSRWLDPVRGRIDNSESGAFALYHTEDPFEHLVRRHGPPPGAFHSVDSCKATFELPVIEITGGLFDDLKRRETVRKFDTEKAMALEDASTLLYYTFGCHGTQQLSEQLVAVKKCSPSGGALHPVEAYPLVLNVDQIPVGLYHYNVEHHNLDLIDAMDESAARELAVEITADQDWYALANMLVIMTGRFDRLFWKYRNNSKAYKVLFLDAGHLSQTFYLICTEFGLGPFFTAAVKDTTIEERLGLAEYKEGVLGICGCGIPGDVSAWRFDYTPYMPRANDD